MKYKLDDMSKVVIGSGSLYEAAFQVCNFMNMLYLNIDSESNCMSNEVIFHNIKTYFKRLNDELYSKYQDEVTRHIINVHYDDIISSIGHIIDEINQIKLLSSNKELQKIKQTEEIINKARKIAYIHYNQCWKSINSLYTDYNFVCE